MLAAVCVRSLKRELSYMSLLDEFTPHLRGVITNQCYGSFIASVPFFRVNITGVNPQDAKAETKLFAQQVCGLLLCVAVPVGRWLWTHRCPLQIAMKLRPMAFSPKEYIMLAGDEAKEMCVSSSACRRSLPL